MSRFRPIHHTFAPLADGKQLRLALSLLLHPGRWNLEKCRDEMRRELNQRCKGETFLFSSGREALAAFLKALPHQEGDEVIVQAYTCVVVPNAIAAAGLVPVYADIEKATLNLDPLDVEKKITPRTKAVICQHTFGIPAPMDALRDLCDRHHLLLIEDCAHVLPDAKGPEEVTAKGDALLMSFGRDKAVSGVTGGAIVCRRKECFARLKKAEEEAIELPKSVIARLLLYPLLYAIARPLYGLGLGKLLLVAARRTGLLLPIVTPKEKHGKQSPTLHRLPEPCAAMVMEQFKELRRINAHRRAIVWQYLEACAAYGWPVLHGIRTDLPLQKFPLFVKDARTIRAQLKQKNIHLDDGWTGCVVCPKGVDMNEARYHSGSDPQAEEACEEILSLPTHPQTTPADARRLVHALAAFL
jgi:dTDP-4-amino-4,6-dideoxygalactose transaminase